MGIAFTFWNTSQDYFKIITPKQLQKYVPDETLWLLLSPCGGVWTVFPHYRVFFETTEGFTFSRGIGTTIIGRKLLSKVSQAHRRPQPGPAQRRSGWAPVACQPLWGQRAAAQPPSPAGSIGLKCLAGPLPLLFSPLAASLMIQSDSEYREIG